MKALKVFIIATLFSISGIALAHQNHNEFQEMDISQSEAIMIATNEVREKVEAEELDRSWDSVKSKSAVLERMNGRQVWKVSFSQTEDTETEVLDVFISKTGDFISLSK